MRFNRTLYAVLLSAFLAAPALAQQATPHSSPASPSNRPSAGTSTPQQGLIDINSASAQELASLPGIGDARAQAIIKGRPYKGKDELAQRKIVPQNVYDQIKQKIVARQSTGSAGSSSMSGSSSSKGK
jgi:competence protein ComEA